MLKGRKCGREGSVEWKEVWNERKYGMEGSMEWK